MRFGDGEELGYDVKVKRGIGCMEWKRICTEFRCAGVEYWIFEATGDDDEQVCTRRFYLD